MRAFITGIAGFAGTHLAEHLLSSGDAVLGCSLDGAWSPDVPPGVAEGASLTAWDIAKGLPTALVRRVADFGPNIIFHLAAISIPSECGQVEPTAHAIRINVEGTAAVVQLAATLPTHPRVVLISSCRVYAPVDFAQPYVSETYPLGPTNGYGKTKLAAEEVLHRSAERGVNGIVLRAFNHAGPRQPPKLMLSEWCRQLVQGDDPVQVKYLDGYLDMTDVRDVVRAYRLLAQHGRAGETYNVGGGQSLRTGDIFEQLLQMHEPGRRFVELFPGRRQDPVADLTKLQSTIAWRPQISLAQTLQDTLAYWMSRSAESA